MVYKSVLLQLSETILSLCSELLLDADELVVLSHTVGTRERTCLDLTRVGSNCDVSDGSVLSLTRAVAGNGGIAVTMSHLDSVEGLRERTDLVNLDQDRVGSAHLDTLLQELHVGNEEVVAYELAAVADALGQLHPVVPVVLIETILDRVDRILVDELLEVSDLLVGRELLTVRILLFTVLQLTIVVEPLAILANSLQP